MQITRAVGVGGKLIDEMVIWLRECGISEVTGFATDGRMARIFARHRISPMPSGFR
jgi:hypothetical protein